MKPINILLLPYRYYQSVLASLILSFLTLSAFDAHAAACESWDSSYSRNIAVPIIGPGVITAGEDLPIGSILYAQTYTPKIDTIGYKCSWSRRELPITIQPYLQGQTLISPSGPPTESGNKSVFPTNIPGVGLVIYVKNASTESTGKMPFKWSQPPVTETRLLAREGTEKTDSIAIELIKTGPVVSSDVQQVLASSFPWIVLSNGVDSPFSFYRPYWTIRFSGAVSIVTKTCQVSDVDVNLGKHLLSDFSKVGSASEWKDFQITLKNCPPFHGYQSSRLNLHQDEIMGDIGSNAFIKNKLTIIFNSVNGYHDDFTAKLESGDNAAEGLGLQIGNKNESVLNIRKANGYNTGLPLTQVDGANYIIPLKARYYRFGDTVKGGKANGAIAYTINYY
ncbi:fimbrial protein [Pragia fontium]|uniref:Pilin (Type 1 fimbria component protein) n=1 Tax=Pragia fontium DSM 5563 = ATCC 49100 TaxID=1122977 RepID=A0AAJ5BIC3_9GAMM|nr:fimbrial protein [Pragia fontium]SFD28586.1 Pilin (type 1 fimbria component protein) [Pragia fontium DSM 5563 = ATCC 49100]VEJ56808.1 fimbrial protein [Pragia fontium]